MSKEYFISDSQLTTRREKIAQEIIDVLVKHNLSNLEADIILEITSCKKNNLRITAEYITPIY